MNERIEKLARKAGISILYEYDGYDGHAGVLNFDDIEKFAELIVGECMEQIWYTREDGINGNVSEVIKDRIKEHFGVEE